MVDIYTRYDEIQRTLEQGLFRHLQTYLREQGELIPAPVQLDTVKRILDVACGSGQWVLDVAQQYPEKEVTGLDHNTHSLQWGSIQARTRRMEQVHFLAGDMSHMKEIADRSFDLAHARFLAPAISPLGWEPLLQELLRVCAPGGTVVWTEATFPLTNSMACFQLCQWIEQAITLAGHTPDITQIMDVLLAESHCQSVQKLTTCLDLSTGTTLHTCLHRDLLYVLEALQAFLSQRQVASNQEIDEQCRDALIDLYGDDFRMTWTLTTVVGKKLV